MFDSLSTITRLQTLELPVCSGFPHLSALAGGSLRSLVLHTAAEDPAPMLDQALQLTQLRELRLTSHAWEPRRRLPPPTRVGSLPPALESLTLRWGPFIPWTVELTTRGGRVLGATMSCAFRPESFGWCASWAASLLAACTVPGSELESLVLDKVDLTAAESLQAPALAPLWELMRRCRRVEVQRLQVDSAATAVRAARWLGKPTDVRLTWTDTNIVGFDLRPTGQSPAAATWPAAALATTAATGRDPANSPTTLTEPLQTRQPAPSAVEVWPAVLQRLTGGPVPDLAVGGQGTAGSTDTDTGIRIGDGGEATEAPSCSKWMLLLCGPALSALVQFPATLKSWLQDIDAASRAGAGGDGGGVGGGGNGAKASLFLWYQALPASTGCHGVLVRCREGGAGAAAAAVQTTALRRGFGRQLASVPLAGKAAREEYRLGHVLPVAVRQELQSLWDGRVAECGGDPEAELGLMRRLLELGSQLTSDMPPLVRL
ncbi:hypothetical protein GPECTOR_1g193 [Gonium pectorale]|uniref:Uncharacterized protein n=1 Tax=Gonium pectorale TaxID=33097 RepID=A0A150H2L0_GONPE|nr:hypothetical protein GPECTOR_1g193 [Gonium pectorale]|eukprot:KXZ56222.1 hypothetical protein GPECTOR_1g193 [Gonium pectorale]